MVSLNDLGPHMRGYAENNNYGRPVFFVKVFTRTRNAPDLSMRRSSKEHTNI